MKNIIRIIDATSEWAGKATRWLCVALVAVMTFEIIMRYVFNAPTKWSGETAVMLGATIAAMGWSYTHRYHGHIRVDVIYRLLPPRWKATIDVILALVFLFPWVIAIGYAAVKYMCFAWSIDEKMMESTWYPPAGPLRTMVFLGLALLAIQSIAHFICDLHLLIRNKPYD